MPDDRWQRIEELFGAALEIEPDRRAAFLTSECGSDEALRRDVEALLASHKRAGNFIQTPAVDEALTIIESPELTYGKGQRIGPYEVIREIGRGGMGAVYLAVRADDEYKKRVAIKLIKRGMDSYDIIRRFRNERQILASLNHSNIARLLDGGTTQEGSPYFVMEYIEGLPLIDYCDAQHMSIAARLRLFQIICAAVQHAHQNLVVHRDLKPKNLLVTPDGEPKLLDFGIAKFLNPEMSAQTIAPTATAVRVMTRDYASPEQVRGQPITTASDIYSLGVLLYKLLTGHHPYQFKTPLLDEMERVICETTPLRPSDAIARIEEITTSDGETVRLTPEEVSRTRESEPQKLRRKLSGDLDNIILMAMRKEPARRYKSVEQLSEDIERHLTGLPVIARKDTFVYRASKFVSRHKAGVAATLLVALAVIAGIIATLWQSHVARQQRDRAEKRFNDVRKLSNSLLFEIAPKIERLQGSTEAREILVARALEYLNSLAEESQSDTQLQSELASAYEKIGDLQGNPNRPNLSDFAGALASYEKANAIRRNLSGSAENLRRLAQIFRESAAIRFIQNDFNGSLQSSEEALKIYERLTADDPLSFELQTEFIKTQLEYGQTHSSNNQFAVAVPLFQKALTALEALDPTNRETRMLTARASAFLGNALSWDGRQQEAEAEMAKAVAAAEELFSEYPEDTNALLTVWRVYALASSVYEGTRDDTSLEFAGKALRVAEKSAASDPADMQARHNVAKTFSRVGIVSINLNRIGEGLSNLEMAERILLELMAREPKNLTYQNDLGRLYTRFGDAREKQNDLPGALRAFQKSADLFEKISRTDEKNLLAQRDLAQSLKSVGKAYLKLKNTEKARQALQTALEILNRLKERNALGGFDNKLLGEVQAAMKEL